MVAFAWAVVGAVVLGHVSYANPAGASTGDMSTVVRTTLTGELPTDSPEDNTSEPSRCRVN